MYYDIWIMVVKRRNIQIAVRKIISMKPDGNCFYRTLSYQLFGTREEYDIATIHGVVYRSEMYNKLIIICKLPYSWP